MELSELPQVDSVYRLFPYRTASLPPPPLFLAPGPPPVDPLPPQGPAPSGVSQVDAVEPVEVAVDSGAAPGAEPAGAGSGGAESGGAGTWGAEPGGAEPWGAEPGGAEPGGAEPGVTEPGGAEPGGAGRAAGAGGAPATTGSGGTSPGGAGATGPGGAAEAAGVGPTRGSAGVSGGTGAAGSAGPAAAGATGVGAAGGVGAGGSAGAGTSEGAGAGATGAGGATGVGAPTGSPGAVPAGSGGALRPRPYFVPLLEQVLGLPPSPGPAPPLESPQPVQSQSLLQPVSPLPAPSPYTGPTGGLAERRAPASRPASPARPACTSRRTSRPRAPAVPGTHQMALRPSTAPLRVPLPSPPASLLPAFPDPESDSLRDASPTVARFLATVVTDPSLASTAASALVAELVDFAASCRLDYAASLVAESASVCPPSVGDPHSTGTGGAATEGVGCSGAIGVPRASSGGASSWGCSTATTVLLGVATVVSATSWRVVLPFPPASSLPDFHDPVSDLARVAYPTVIRCLATLVTDPTFYLVPESDCPLSIGGDVGCDVLEVRQFELECLADAVPHLAAMLLALEGDPNALDIPTPHSYAEAIMGQYSSQWQTIMYAEMASSKSTGTYVDTLPPPGANIVGDIWIFRCDTLALGFAPSTTDPALFLRTDSTLPPLYIIVYVDDLVFATDDSEALTLVQAELQKRHICTGLGELRRYLGLHITQDRAARTITLTQSHMVQQVLQRFHFQFSSPQPTPLPTAHSLSAPPSYESIEPSGLYPQLVGCLMYLMTCTRPDLAYPLSILARYVASGRHRPEYWRAATRVLRYLASTSGMGLVLGGRGSVVLTGHSDASWADDQATSHRLAAPSHPPRRPPTEPRRSAEPRRPTEPRHPTKPCRPTGLHCPACSAPAATAASAATAATVATAATAATAATSATASPTVLTFDAEGRAVDFDVWVDDLQLFLQCDSRDGVSLFDHTSGVSTAPAATIDSTVRSQWTTRDAVAHLAVRSHLPSAERAHFGQYKTTQSLYDAVVARYSSPATAALSRLMLPYLFSDLAAFATVADLITHLRTSDSRYGAALPTEFCAKNPPPPPMYITLYYLVTRLPDSLASVRDHFLSLFPTECQTYMLSYI
ncbi:unnamed protein product [Closterium sp. NIES-54]